MKRRLAVLALIPAAAGVIAAALLARDLYRPYRAYAGSILFEVEPGMSAPAVAQALVERGVLAHRFPFLARYALGRLRQRSLKAGEYVFDRPLRPMDVYWRMARGEVYLHPVIIPEGSDRFDMASIYQQALGIDPDKFLRASEDRALVHDLDPQAPTLEGYLFPDTYRFPRGTSAARAVVTMVERFRRIFESELRGTLDQQPASLHEVVTLASLVEKETPNPAERPIVAQVFAKRLQIGWPLACDPTVIYAERLNHHMLERPLPPITQSGLRFDSPFNTYLHKGLPPSPIASPGLASLRAALDPAHTDYLYFVSNHQGGHNFARTLAEHQRNVARYRRDVMEFRRAAAGGKSSSDAAAKPAPARPGGQAGRRKNHKVNRTAKRPATRAQRQE